MKDLVCTFILHVSIDIVYMVNIRIKDLKVCRIQILKHQTPATVERE